MYFSFRMRKGLLFSINLSINLFIIIIIILEKMTQAIYCISTTVVNTQI